MQSFPFSPIFFLQIQQKMLMILCEMSLSFYIHLLLQIFSRNSYCNFFVSWSINLHLISPNGERSKIPSQTLSHLPLTVFHKIFHNGISFLFPSSPALFHLFSCFFLFYYPISPCRLVLNSLYWYWVNSFYSNLAYSERRIML